MCVGEDDQRVSRRHGSITYRSGQWWVTATGRLPLRLPQGQRPFPSEAPVPLAAGYTPLFVQGSSGREHLLEVYVAGDSGTRPVLRHRDPTQPPRIWHLGPDDRLALIVGVPTQSARTSPATWASTTPHALATRVRRRSARRERPPRQLHQHAGLVLAAEEADKQIVGLGRRRVGGVDGQGDLPGGVGRVIAPGAAAEDSAAVAPQDQAWQAQPADA